MKFWLFMLKRDRIAYLIQAAELAVVYVLLALSASCILQTAGISQGSYNGDAVTLFCYIACAALTLYFFTVSLNYAVNFGKSSALYATALVCGATKGVLLKAKTLCLLSAYGAAFLTGACVCVALNFRYLAEDGIRFFTFGGQGIASAAYILLWLFNFVADVVFIDSVGNKKFTGGGENG